MSATPVPQVQIRLPAALLQLFPNCPKTTNLTADTVSAAIDALNACWPGLRDRLCDERPAPRRHIKIFVDGAPATLTTPLHPNAEIVILTAISGG